MKTYDEWVANNRSDCDNLATYRFDYDIVCLANEAGELLGELKTIFKQPFGAECNNFYREKILLECGDILHYLSRVLNDIDSDLQECAEANVEKLTNRAKYGKGKKGLRS